MFQNRRRQHTGCGVPQGLDLDTAAAPCRVRRAALVWISHGRETPAHAEIEVFIQQQLWRSIGCYTQASLSQNHLVAGVALRAVGQRQNIK
jgi:hypothetical protein